VSSDSSDSDCSVGSSDHMSNQVGPESPELGQAKINFEDELKTLEDKTSYKSTSP
jgi:hypothetical protein